jgi:hypothetical protein
MKPWGKCAWTLSKQAPTADSCDETYFGIRQQSLWLLDFKTNLNVDPIATG